jgi:cyclase
MTHPRVIPVLLLKGDGLYKGVQFKNYKYVGDPINAVRIFNDKDVDELLFLDITAAADGRFISPDLVQRVADESYMPFGVGGGIRSVEQIRQLLKAGAEKVSINTAAVENPDLIRAASELAGRQSVTVAIDVRRNWLGKYHVYTHSGARKTDLDPLEWALKAEGLGAGEILVNSIDRDGTGKGYDLEITRKLADAVKIPVIACGGAGKYADCVEAIEQGHASAAAAGSLFVFVGPHRSVLINYPDEGIWAKA